MGSRADEDNNWEMFMVGPLWSNFGVIPLLSIINVVRVGINPLSATL